MALVNADALPTPASPPHGHPRSDDPLPRRSDRGGGQSAAKTHDGTWQMRYRSMQAGRRRVLRTFVRSSLRSTDAGQRHRPERLLHSKRSCLGERQRPGRIARAVVGMPPLRESATAMGQRVCRWSSGCIDRSSGRSRGAGSHGSRGSRSSRPAATVIRRRSKSQSRGASTASRCR